MYPIAYLVPNKGQFSVCWRPFFDVDGDCWERDYEVDKGDQFEKKHQKYFEMWPQRPENNTIALLEALIHLV